jgi:hypothetical protein
MKQLTSTIFFVSLFLSPFFSNAQHEDFWNSNDPEEILRGALMQMNNSPLENTVNYREIANRTSVYNNGWVKQDSIHKSYISGELVGEELLFTWLDSIWANFGRHTYMYDANDQMTEQLTQELDSSGWNNRNLRLFTYDPVLNKETSETAQIWNTGDSAWQNDYQTITALNASGFRDTFLVQNWGQSAWANSSRTIYQRDTSQNVLIQTMQIWDDPQSQWINSLKTDYTYLNNNLDSAITRTWDQNQNEWSAFRLSTYAYSSADLLDSIILHDWDSTMQSWMQFRRISYEYSPGGIATNITYSNWDSSWQNWFRFIYDLDSLENVQRFSYEFWNDTTTTFDFINETVYYYEAFETTGSSPTFSSLTHKAYPNPFNEKIQVQFENPAYESAELVIFNMAGQEIFREKKRDDSFVWNGRDLSGQRLSAGMYTYRLRVGDKVGAGKVFLLGL